MPFQLRGMAKTVSKGAECPSASPEELAALETITETADYRLVVLSPSMREALDTNYGIVNKQYNVIEAMYGVLFAGYQLISELQAKLDAEKPEAAPVLTTVQ